MKPHTSARSLVQASRFLRGAALTLSSVAGVVIMAFALLHPASLNAGEAKKANFELPADRAEKALKELALQSGVEVVLASEVASGVRTNEVRGELSPLEAATRMLVGTDLRVEEDPSTRALIVGRRPADLTRKIEPQQKEIVKPAESAVTNEVVKLEAFRVSTDLGRYAEEVTSAGSKMPVEIKDLPVAVGIFNSSNIKDRLAENLDDIYPYVTGMAKEAPISTGFNIRGFTAQGAGVMHNIQVDGLPGLASRYSSPNSVNVERLEVVKGPTSVLYGKLNPGGLVNIVTKRPMAKSATSVHASVSTYAGSYSPVGDDMAFKASIDDTGPIDAAKHWDYRLIVEGEDLQTWRRNTWFKNYYVYPSLTYRWNEKTSFTVMLEVVREKRQYDNGIPYPPFNNPANLPAFDTLYQDKNSPERDSGRVVSGIFQHLFANSWKLSVSMRSVYHSDDVAAYRTNQNFSQVVTATPVTNSTVRRNFFARIITREYNYSDANIYRDFGAEKWRHKLLVGVNGGVERADSDFIASANTTAAATGLDKVWSDFVNYYYPVTGLSPIPPPGTRIAPRITKVNYHNYGAYISDLMKFGRHWGLLLAARCDGQDSESNQYQNWATTANQLEKKSKTLAVLPAVGLIYEASDRVSCYLATNRSFKPAPVDANVDENGRIDFPPETGGQYEFGIKSQLFDKRLIVNFAAYEITKKNVLEATGTNAPNGLPMSRVTGEQRSRGLELEGIWLPLPNWQIQAGATLIDAKVTKSSNKAAIGQRLVVVARESGNFWTRYNVTGERLRGFGVGLGATVKGKWLAGTPATQTASYLAPGWIRFDTAFYYQMKRTDLALNITNIMDRKYIASSGENGLFPGEPRRLTLSNHYRF